MTELDRTVGPGRWVALGLGMALGAAACGDRQVVPAVEEDLDPAELLSATEQAAASLAFMSVIDGSQAYLAANQVNDPTLSPTAPSPLGTFSVDRGVCLAHALMDKAVLVGAQRPAWVPPNDAEGSQAEQVFSLDFTDSWCASAGRALSGRQTLAVLKNTGSSEQREVWVAPAIRWTVAGGEVTRLSPADPAVPGIALTGSSVPTLAPQGLQMRLMLRADRTGAGGEDAGSWQVSTQDPNNPPLELTQTYANLGSVQLRPPPGSTMPAQATVDVSLVADGQLTLRGLEDGGVATHRLTRLAADLSKSCRCPASGELMQEVVYASGRVAKHTFTFGACGRAKVSSLVSSATAPDTPTASDTGTVVFAACGG